MSSDYVIVDALPYIDHEYDQPGVREAVLAMVEEETRRYRPTKNYLEHLPPLNLHQFETDIHKVELDRLQSRTPMEMMSMKRYELPPPPHGKLTDLQAWTEAVDNSHAQLEQQVTRIANLELLEKYGAEAWKGHNEILVNLTRDLQGKLSTLRKEIQEIHYQRKTSQTEVGEKLSNLEQQWVGLVSKNYEIERVCAEMEIELARLEEQRQRAKRDSDTADEEEVPVKKPREDTEEEGTDHTGNAPSPSEENNGENEGSSDANMEPSEEQEN